MKNVLLFAVAFNLIILPSALGQKPSDLKKLFPSEADIFVDSGKSKLVRLDLPAEILTDCKADLSDLRILDRAGNEVAFLLDRGSLPTSSSTLKQVVKAKIQSAELNSTGQENGPKVVRETYELAVPQTQAESGSWDLVFKTERSHFIRRVDISEVDGQQPTMLVNKAAVFRLARADAEQTRVTLPAKLGKQLRIILTGEDESYLEPIFIFESTRKLPEKSQVAFRLTEVRREKRNGKTIIELIRPSGIVPSGLQLETTTAAFDRLVEVFDLGPGSRDVLIGRNSIFRVETVAPVENRELRLAPAVGNRLRVEIEDGDSPTLSDLTFRAIIYQPALIFALMGDNTGTPAARLLFGGGRAHLPRYDLAGLIPSENTVVLDDRARVTAGLFSSHLLRSARTGAVRTNLDFDSEPVLAFAMHAGAEIDPRLYSHRRKLFVLSSDDGLSRLRITSADLAILRTDLADIRIIDAKLRQWPYLLEKDSEQEWIDVTLKVSENKNRASHYRLDFPTQPVTFLQLSISAADPFFDRAYSLIGTDSQGNEFALAQGRLVKGATAPMQHKVVEINTTPRPIKYATLIVEDGENASLTLQSVRALVSLPNVYLAAPHGEYTLLLGQPEDQTPVYDISRVRDFVLAVGSGPVESGPLEQNPEFRRRARLAAGSGPEHILLWLTIGVAVIVLGVFTFRLARREGEQKSRQA